MDLAAQKEKREARMQAKREAIRTQNESVADSEAAAVAEKTPVAETETKKDEK